MSDKNKYLSHFREAPATLGPSITDKMADLKTT